MSLIRPRVAVAGAGGFVGHHVVEHLLVNTPWHVVALDSFRHRGVTSRIRQLIDSHPEWADRITVVTHDLTAPIDPITDRRIGDVDTVFHLASESHVDRSITHPAGFVKNNVDVAIGILEWIRSKDEPPLLIAVSTDEVYGPAPVGTWHQEWDPIVPSNPYAASKAAQEAIAVSYWRAYNLPIVLTNTMNIIGERQDPEKFVPMLIQRALDGTPIEIHGQDGIAGSRYYLHARNQADALLTLALAAREDPYTLEEVCRSVGRNPGGSLRYSALPNDRPLRFHIVGEQEVTNDRLADAVVGQVIERTGANPPDMTVVNFHASRPGHDLRYALDGGRMAALGWKAPVPLWDSLIRTVDWTLAHPEWIRL